MKDKCNYTLVYYDTHAKAFFQSTVGVVFQAIQERFLEKLQKGADILDFGCGSGRDTRYFLERGYSVDAMDGSEQMCRLAEAYTKIQVRHQQFQELSEVDRYDGIWACASILHLPGEELTMVLRKMETALRSHGVIYTSFKYGTFAGERNGRYFTDQTEASFAELLQEIDGLTVEEQWVTADTRPGREAEQWLNLILRKK